MSPSLVLLPAMLCDNALYAPQTESLREGDRSVFPARPSAATARETFRTMSRRLGAETFLRQHATLFRRQDRRGDLARIECPTLLTWGREDAFSDVGHASLMASRIPNADLVVLDAGGHLPTMEQPPATTKVARAWLERIEAGV
jgi:pimeloyl-ACP methyl ester carboxylesterase